MSDEEENIGESVDLTEEDLEVLTDPDPDPFPVSYAGSDFDVEGLVRRLIRGDIVVPRFGGSGDNLEVAGFQRRFVWRRVQMDRFIESLLLGYPIPGIFLVQQKDRRYLVLDGQQRLTTLERFYDDRFALKGVSDALLGLTYRDLSDEQKRTLDSTFVHATIVQTDGSNESLDTIYQIFERLNSGGTQLTAHEIRVALLAGPLIDFIAELNETHAFRTLYGPVSPRLRDQELILRFLALFSSPGDYRRPLKKYLTEFASHHRDLQNLNVSNLKSVFVDATVVLSEMVGRRAFRRDGKGAVNAAMTDAVLVGMAHRISAGQVTDNTAVETAFGELLADPSFDRAISRATADEESVRTRLALAVNKFAGV